MHLTQRFVVAAAEIIPTPLEKDFVFILESWGLCLEIQGGHIEMYSNYVLLESISINTNQG